MSHDFWSRLPLGILWIFGIYTLFEKGMILGRLGDWGAKLMPKWATKPLYDCPSCMASFHGTIIWFGTNGDLWRWPIFCIVLCGCNRLLSHNLND